MARMRHAERLQEAFDGWPVIWVGLPAWRIVKVLEVKPRLRHGNYNLSTVTKLVQRKTIDLMRQLRKANPELFITKDWLYRPSD